MNAFNIPAFAIPGLMTVRSPNAEQQKLVGDDGSLNLVVWCQEPAEPIRAVTFLILDEEYKIQFQDLVGQYVFHNIQAGRREYTVILPPRQVGLGSYVLAVYIDGKAHKAFDIVREDNGFSDWRARNSFYQLPKEQSGSQVNIPTNNLPEEA
jgi:hypothetical protein